MQKNIYLPIIAFLAVFLFSNLVFAATPETVAYICDLGVAFYNQGRYEEALSQFNDVLELDPENETAKSYLSNIFKIQNTKSKENAPQQSISPALSENIATENPVPDKNGINREQAIDEAFGAVDGKNPNKTSKPLNKKDDEGIKAGPFKLTGEVQLSFGVTPDDFIWKKANFSLNDKPMNWRLNSYAVSTFNHKFNTYDPAIYDSLSLNIDTDNKTGFNLHTNLTVDPWSYTGKSTKTTVTGSNGDTANIQLYYWSNTGYTVNKTIYTSLKADTINLQELKVTNGATSATTLVSTSGATYNLSSLKIETEFQPLRELWLDYANDQVKFRAFPMSYQDQAYTSDDPLNITNHGIWWKDSKWLRNYTAGTFNSGDTTPSYTKGRWDDSLSFLSKDSTGRYLTALRGFSFNFQPDELTSFDTTIASPKNLWQDYSALDNVIAVSRLKHHFTDRFMLGGTFTSRTGFLSDSDQKIDSQNYVGGMDFGYELLDGLMAKGEALVSNSKYDMTSNDYKTDGHGNAYFFSIIDRYPQKSIMDLKYGYDEIAMDKDETFLVKSKIYGGSMDKGFDSALSDFHKTRQDTFWSRHIHFRKTLDYYSQGMEKSGVNWDELNATRIGDGLDIGRNALGFRVETNWDNKIYNLFDERNVHKTSGKFAENVARDEATIKLTDKLTIKGLGIYQKMPHTVGGVDPFVYDGDTGEYYLNNAVKDGEDPSIKTGSLGFNYDFFDWLSFNGVYERTNDYTIAYDNFPQSVFLNNTSLYGSYYQNEQLYKYILPLLYNQGIFPQAPYPYYNVFKCGLRIAPTDTFEIYIDYTRNEYEAASLNSDGMNHVGIEFAYTPNKKFGMVFKYIYSRSKDIDRMVNGDTKMYVHNNFSNEFRYMPSKDDEFIMQYGIGDAYSISNLSSLDPYGGGSITLDTQHIIRAYYRRKF